MVPLDDFLRCEGAVEMSRDTYNITRTAARLERSNDYACAFFSDFGKMRLTLCWRTREKHFRRQLNQRDMIQFFRTVGFLRYLFE